MNYQETLSYLFSRLPMFTRVGSAAYKANLDNIISFCEELDNPQEKFKSIHVAGTNGKGSTSHMLAAILQTAGYKTGLYTSPHLRDFRERIRINGKMISETDVVNFVAENKAVIEKLEPSFFEATVAMAFNHFEKHHIDIAVIEVGLGGRLDSTNIINPLLSVITNIGMDHMAILGEKIEQIAAEKAGIIKPNIPVVVGEKQEEIAEIFTEKASSCNSSIRFASDEWEIKSNQKDQLDINTISVEVLNKNNPESHENYLLDLTGTYQLKNLATVLSSVDELRKIDYKISNKHVFNALSQVKNLTGLMGRWQILQTNPMVICDTGHNEAGIIEVVKNIESVKFEKLHVVIGMVKDKEIGNVLKLLPNKATYYFCQPDIPRAKEAMELMIEAREYFLIGDAYKSVREAYQQALKNASEDDLVFVGGSTFVVAEVV